MDRDIKELVEKSCSSCDFGILNEHEEPCATCDELGSNVENRYSKWVFDPNYGVNLIYQNVPEHRLNNSLEILQYMFEFYKLGNPYKHNYDSYDLSEYLNSLSMHLLNMTFDKLHEPQYFNFSCRPFCQDLSEIIKELNRFVKHVIKKIIQNKRKTHMTLLFGEIRSATGKDITSKAIDVMKNALLVAKAKNNEIRNDIILDKIKRIKSLDTPEQIKKATDDIYRHRDNAKILIERVNDGTFPYDKHGVWRLN